ncbi:DUF262 domain-containing protein [Vagococcus lutrae]|uniref:DUF262 domain-containing protein n=1 Tax=Vagococcus lutrae TaxID=81947 RepID=A0AAF0BBN8_9ENTE|nr:DUF262 domain-containing protein [Vagococcus lutrae]WCG21843.1 DUF262 domain-containing protein [Vagococcus lutrae]
MFYEKIIDEFILNDGRKKELINNLEFKDVNNVTFKIENYELVDENTFSIGLSLIGESQEYRQTVELRISNNTVQNWKLIDSEDLAEKEIKKNKLSFDIDYWAYNITYDQLSRMYESKKINIPDMQRGFVWDHVQASKLIESILMGLPLPSLFLIKQDDGSYLVVDGLQRITSIHAFKYNKRLPNSKPNVAGFSLKGVNGELEGKTYSDLEEESPLVVDRFDMGTINVIEFKQNKPEYEEAMYSLFERLNSGGTTLSDQQIRNSVYYGTFNKQLNQFSKNNIEKYFSPKSISNMDPSEHVLRSISVYDLLNPHFTRNMKIDTSRIIYKKLLNKTAEKYHIEFKKIERDMTQNFEDHENKIGLMFEEYKEAIVSIERIFMSDAFKRYDSIDKVFTNRFSPIIFESLIVSYLLFKDEYSLSDTKEIIEKYKGIFEDGKEYEDYFTQGTGQIKNMIGRVETMKRVLFNE